MAASLIAAPPGSGSELIPILLVDDQPSNLTALEAILATSGCQLVSAQSADEALLALLERDFAAIVLDVRMPGMSGFELASMIRQRRRTQHVPILFLTAYLLEPADMIRGYEAGAVDYLTKPISPVVLQSKISVFAELFRKRRELARINEQLEDRVVERTRALSQAHGIVRENDARLRLALEAAGMGSWIWELATDRMTWSPGPVCRSEDFVSEFEGGLADLLTLVHPDDRSLVADSMTAAVGARSDYRCEFRFVRPDGTVRWALAAGRVLTDDAGAAVRVAGIDFDITERKKTEAVLREADRKKDEFLAMLAHELRNPLAPIVNAIQIIQAKGPPEPELVWAREVIARQARQMTRLVDDLLDVSRISLGKLELRRERVRLDAVVQSALETCRPALDARNQTLIVSVPPELIVIDGDATRLAQSLLNLLTNASKYSDHGATVWLSVSVESTEAVISIKDTGIGIPEEMLEHVFEMFAQVDRTLERSQGGLGVGLALVKVIVELHGGSVIARSGGPGTGSEFVIRLPLTSSPGGRISGALAGPVESVSQRILIAEDGRDAADSFGLLLTMMGHEVEVVYDGEAAVTLAKEFQPDVIILDLGMPRLNGYDAARSIRGEPWGKEVFLIALSGWGQPEDRRRSTEAGFDRHLTKPVDPDVIGSVLSTRGR
jgi:signal transduction histidine kinase/CheY-like chemotaxis protein